MIRRNDSGSDDTDYWILIPQIEHAHLAGDLANRWIDDELIPSTIRELFLSVLYRHDDGWKKWQKSPGVDPELGRPLSFTEMPPHAAHEIWRRSISSVTDLGPLAQYLVAAHFVKLRGGGEEADSKESLDFLQEYQPRLDAWINQWQELDPGKNELGMAKRALQGLQFFDRLSLWFCCAEQREEYKINSGRNQSITFSPVSFGQVYVSPWPFSSDILQLRVSGRRIPVGVYQDTSSLLSAISEEVVLSWKLMPKENSS